MKLIAPKLMMCYCILRLFLKLELNFDEVNYSHWGQIPVLTTVYIDVKVVEFTNTVGVKCSDHHTILQVLLSC